MVNGEKDSIISVSEGKKPLQCYPYLYKGLFGFAYFSSARHGCLVTTR